MKLVSWSLLLVVVTASGCGSGANPVAAREKIEGPAVKTLSHDALMAVLTECHQYGFSDDPRVTYTIRYCSAAQMAHSMEGYSAPSTAVVNPQITRMH